MRVVRVYSGDKLSQQLELGPERVTIGRTSDNDLVLPDPAVSKEHAAIEFIGGEYYVVDLGSQNGIFVNNEKVTKRKLKYWDEIQIHNFVIKFMAKLGYGADDGYNELMSENFESDKTEFFDISDEQQLNNLRQQTRQAFVVYTDRSGTTKKFIVHKPRTIIGKGQKADIVIGGWLSPAMSASIERQGGTYELVPGKRGKIVFQENTVSSPVVLSDACSFSVRGVTFKFYNRLAKTGRS